MNDLFTIDEDSEMDDFDLLFGDDDDEEEELERATIALIPAMTANTSIRAIRRYINRDRMEGHERLYGDYFSINSTYNEMLFRRRFRMRHEAFFRLCEAVMDNDDYFIQKRNAAGVLGFSTIQKVTAALRVLCYGTSADSFDEYLRMSETVHSGRLFGKFL